MMERTQRRAAALGAAGAVVSGALAVGIGETTLDAWVGWGRQEVAQGLGVLAGAAAAATSTWITVVLTLATVSILRMDRGATSATAGRPTGPRRSGWTGRVVAGLLVLGSLGVTTATAGAAEPVAACAVATSLGHPEEAGLQDAAEISDPPVTGTAVLPEPGWTPTPTHPDPRPSADVGLVTTATREPVEPVPSVVVRRGDTLWGIAARHLGDRATDQDVAEAWPRWYAANRSVIGEDPHLIRPGQQLTAPASTAGR